MVKWYKNGVVTLSQCHIKGRLVSTIKALCFIQLPTNSIRIFDLLKFPQMADLGLKTNTLLKLCKHLVTTPDAVCVWLSIIAYSVHAFVLIFILLKLQTTDTTVSVGHIFKHCLNIFYTNLYAYPIK